jgi:hypothetical protein
MVKFFRRNGGRRVRDTSLGRNDLCWCGSGRKYKDCHLESDRVRLSRLRSAGCRSFG